MPTGICDTGADDPMNTRKTAVFCLALQSAIVLGECLGTILSIGEYQTFLFSYYTCDSNIFLLIVAAAEICFCVRLLLGRDGRLSRRLLLFRYFATCTTTVTFLVVVLIFAPLAGPGAYPRLLLKGSLKYMHFLCPFLALISFLFAEDHSYLRFRHTLYAMIPTFLYALVTVVLNVARIIRGPYPFLYVYEQPLWSSFLWAVIILGTAWLIAFGLYLLKRGRGGRGSQSD